MAPPAFPWPRPRAAPCKHFRDRHEILRGVAGEAMDRLHAAMEAAAAAHPAGSLEARLGLPAEDAEVRRRAYMLWAFVHGHVFLQIDLKTKVVTAEIDDWLYLTKMSRVLLGRTDPGPVPPRDAGHA
jgi:AcrR family transcriptional regulator